MASIKNHMRVNAISHVHPVDQLEITLAHDHLEVRGFGKPITDVVAGQMIDTFYNDFKKAYEVVQVIETIPAYEELRTHPGFESLAKLINPANQIVSGVFGKEIILQILSQRDCEGIRYAHATDENGLNTIILFGVQQVKNEQGQDVTVRRNGKDIAKSTSLKPFNNSNQVLDNDDLNGEVHEEGLTIEEVNNSRGGGEFLPTVANIIFGEY